MSAATPRPGSRPRQRAHFLHDLIVIVVVALLASFLIRTFLIQSFYIPSASMEHTLLGEPGHHDRILVDRLVPTLVPLQRGDVIAFKDPGDWLEGEPTPPVSTNPLQQAVAALTPFDTDGNDHLVKRVIGSRATTSPAATRSAG